jgi:hypothetical protein
VGNKYVKPLRHLRIPAKYHRSLGGVVSSNG